AIPYAGNALTIWLRGDFAVGDATLTRFYSLHTAFMPVMVIGFLVLMHLTALHRVGSNNPKGIDPDKKGAHVVPFAPYYITKDMWFIAFVFTVFFYFVFFKPDFFLEPLNNEPANSLKTPLHIAAQCGYDDVAGVLLENSADVNAGDMLGCTPLHLAASIGHESMVELLIKNGADVNAKDANGLTPLHLAALYGNNQAVKILIRNDADVNATVTNDGTTPLHCAVSSMDIKSVRLLLDAGADPNAENKTKETPLSLAQAVREDARAGVILRLLEMASKRRASASVGSLDPDRKYRMVQNLHSASGMEFPRHQRNPQRIHLKLVA
ncbi:MAG: ankyrin repeat domain-containing protein, partial [Thaumarchaeota archaeon]|nr:ankyrin repeat domain-containing protein [Nitrososphaerota archaeon]